MCCRLLVIRLERSEVNMVKKQRCNVDDTSRSYGWILHESKGNMRARDKLILVPTDLFLFYHGRPAKDTWRWTDFVPRREWTGQINVYMIYLKTFPKILTGVLCHNTNKTCRAAYIFKKQQLRLSRNESFNFILW